MKLIYTGEQAEVNVPLKNGARVLFVRGVANDMPDEDIALELLSRSDWKAAEE
jgi:hypothetical protein